MKAALIIAGAGVSTLATGFLVGQHLRKKRAQPLGRYRSLGQANHPQTEFVSLLHEMGKAMKQSHCGEARQFLLRATPRAKTAKEKSALLKAYRKLRRCGILR